ncbi:AraC family transcriptional regulator [Leucothrix sargassi]|nr:AraC family transcriptional regulator [Leucothrix sargassi]
MNVSTVTNKKRLTSQAMEASNATCLDYADIQSDVSLAIWCNQDDRVLTHNKHLHTLSIYLEGGDDTYRTDLKSRAGSPDKLCFFPADHTSDWVVGQPLKLAHLYFTDVHLNYLSVTAFDKDPRSVALPDLTFESDPILVAKLHQLLRYMAPSAKDNLLQLQEVQQQIILYLLEHYSQHTKTAIRGGLSPKVKSRVMSYMKDHLGQELTLEQLASEACMSTYHFAHMFKQSVGLSPYQFLLRLRMSEAAQQLRHAENIGDVAESCGYSSSSRFARAFKASYGVTPKVYQRCIL